MSYHRDLASNIAELMPNLRGMAGSLLSGEFLTDNGWDDLKRFQLPTERQADEAGPLWREFNEWSD